MQRVVGRVQIEGDLLGRLRMSIQEQIDKQPFDRGLVMADLVIARRCRLAQFQPVERRLAGDRCAIPAARLELAGQHRHDRVMAKLVMVIQILVAHGQAEYPLPDQRANLVFHQDRRAGILEAGREPIDQPDRPVRSTQQQTARIRRDRPTIKTSYHRTPCDACKSKQIQVTLCRHRGDPLKLIKSFSQNNFLRCSAPMHLHNVRYPG